MNWTAWSRERQSKFRNIWPCWQRMLMAAIAVVAVVAVAPIGALSQQNHSHSDHKHHEHKSHGQSSSTHASSGQSETGHGAPISMTFDVKATGKALERRLLIDLTDSNTGSPIDGATVDVNVDMPSMPMMHSVPMAKAEPTGKPGQYAATVVVEMKGQWAARVTVRKPMRTMAVHRFNVAH